MVAILQKVKLTTESPVPGPFYFVTRPSNITAISAETGVALAETTDPDADAPTMPISSILKSGVGERFIVTYAKGGKSHQGRIIVAADKASAVAKALIGKDYNGGTVTRVHRPLRAYSR